MLVPTKVLKNIVKAAARDSTRYAINGVLIERDDTGPVAVALDGRWMLVARWTEQPWEDHPLGTKPVDGFSVIVPPADLIEASKLPPKREHREILKEVVIDEHDPKANVTTVEFRAHNGDGACSRTVPIIEGNFPKWRDVIPDKNGAVIRITVNPKFLADALKAVADMGCDPKSGGVVLEFTSSDRPLVVRAHNETVDVVAVIMPIACEKKK